MRPFLRFVLTQKNNRVWDVVFGFSQTPNEREDTGFSLWWIVALGVLFVDQLDYYRLLSISPWIATRTFQKDIFYNWGLSVNVGSPYSFQNKFVEKRKSIFLLKKNFFTGFRHLFSFFITSEKPGNKCLHASWANLSVFSFTSWKRENIWWK